MTENNDKLTLESHLIQSVLSEQRTARRWKNARFFTWVILFALSLMAFLMPDNVSTSHSNTVKGDYASLIRMTGTIMPGNRFSAKEIIPELNRAFRDKESQGVVLLINSPGGSPVQASIIHDKIIQLKTKYHKKVIVVAEDMLASGAYLVATAADKIFVSKDTITGSIGVIMEGFGLEGVISKIGVTRRVFTAGDNKDRLDPFTPVTPADKEKIQTVLDSVHQDFINDVTTGRAGKLTGDPKELFSGDFWTGTQAVKLGLADGTANLWEAMQTNFDTTHYRDYTPRPSFWQEVMKEVSTKLHLGLETSHVQLQEVW